MSKPETSLRTSRHERPAKELVGLLRAAKELAVFILDHSYPSEEDIRETISPISHGLCTLASSIANRHGLDIRNLYAGRMENMERGKLGGLFADLFLDYNPEQPLPAENIVGATFEQLQQSQALHDQYFSADVVGLTQMKQLEHHCFHLAKLAGRAAEAQEDNNWPQFYQKYLADTFAFGIILANVAGLTLTEAGMQEYAENLQLAE